MLLKGSVILFDSPYPRRTWSTRMMRDIDLMVPASDLRRATATLVDLGYTTLQQYPDGHHAFGEFVRANDPGSVDLHTELVDTNYILPAKSVWAAAVPLPISGATAVMLPPSERMLHHLLHAQLHYLSDFYRGELRLDQLYEFSVMGTKLGQYIEWERIAHQMAFHRLETALHSYLLSAMELFGAPWPLAAAAGRAARFHGRRCRWQLLLPALRLITAPWGNLRAAFAWHRMKARYGMKGSVIVWRARHAYQFIRRTTMRGALGRVFRYEQ